MCDTGRLLCLLRRDWWSSWQVCFVRHFVFFAKWSVHSCGKDVIAIDSCGSIRTNKNVSQLVSRLVCPTSRQMPVPVATVSYFWTLKFLLPTATTNYRGYWRTVKSVNTSIEKHSPCEDWYLYCKWLYGGTSFRIECLSLSSIGIGISWSEQDKNGKTDVVPLNVDEVNNGFQFKMLNVWNTEKAMTTTWCVQTSQESEKFVHQNTKRYFL